VQNEQRRPARNAAATYDEPSVPRRFVVRALDSLELGDCADAAEILLAALEDVATEATLQCRWCPARFAWPGEREGHEVRAHPWELVDAA
jgi:hypothetical protein